MRGTKMKKKGAISQDTIHPLVLNPTCNVFISKIVEIDFLKKLSVDNRILHI